MARTAALGVSNLVGRNRATSKEVEEFCVDLLVRSFVYRAPAPHLIRVVEDLVAGGIRHAGKKRRNVAAGLIRGAIRGGQAIGLSPAEAAIVAVETAALHWSDVSDPELIPIAVKAAQGAMEGLGGDQAERLARWLDERQRVPELNPG